MDQRVNDHSRPERRSRSESAAKIADAVSQMHQTVYEMDKAAENFFETELLDDSSDEESEEQPTRSRSESAAQIAQAVTQMHQTAYEMDKAAEDFYDMGAPAVDQIRSAPFGGDCEPSPRGGGKSDVVDLADIMARMGDAQLEDWGSPSSCSGPETSWNSPNDDSFAEALELPTAAGSPCLEEGNVPLSPSIPFSDENNSDDNQRQSEFFESGDWETAAAECNQEQPTRSRSESAAQIAQAVAQMHQTAYEMDKAAEDFYDMGAPAVDQIRSAPFGGDCDVVDLAEIAARMAQDEQLEEQVDYEWGTPTHSFRDSSHNLSREGDDDTYQDTLNPQQLTEFAEFVQDHSTQDSIEEQPTRSRSESAAQIAALVTQMHQTAYEMDKAAEDFHDAGAPAVDQIRSAPFGGDCDVLDLAEIAARMAQDEQLEDEHDYATPTAIY